MFLKTTIMAAGALACLMALTLYDQKNNEARSYRHKPDFSQAYFTGFVGLALLVYSQFI